MSLVRARRLRLVDRVEGDGRRDGVKHSHLHREVAGRVHTHDTELPNLPPVAVSKGWGDMSWLHHARGE